MHEAAKQQDNGFLFFQCTILGSNAFYLSQEVSYEARTKSMCKASENSVPMRNKLKIGHAFAPCADRRLSVVMAGLSGWATEVAYSWTSTVAAALCVYPPALQQQQNLQAAHKEIY